MGAPSLVAVALRRGVAPGSSILGVRGPAVVASATSSVRRDGSAWEEVGAFRFVEPIEGCLLLLGCFRIPGAGLSDERCFWRSSC